MTKRGALCILTMFIALLGWASLDVSLPSYISFSTQGGEKDTYADGTVVLDGEVYACVWVKNGYSFAGLMANGQLVDPVNNKLVGAAPLAKGGHCKPVVFMLNGENACLSGGTFEVYLLDTRVSSAQGIAPMPAALAAAGDKSLTVVNGYTPIGATGATSANEVVAARGDGNVSVLPPDVPRPVIKSIRILNGKVVLTVGNTMPFIRYGISSGSNPGNLTKNFDVPGVNGSGEGSDLTLVIDNPEENRFFKVIRKP